MESEAKVVYIHFAGVQSAYDGKRHVKVKNLEIGSSK